MKSATILFNDFELHFFKNTDGDYIAVKPICQALGVNYSTQIDKIKSHPILGSDVPLMGTTGADKKTYQMTCIPVRYVFGWLMAINANKVNEQSREKLIQYQEECYNVLYDHFHSAITNRSDILSNKTLRQMEIQQLENSLLENESYKKLLELKAKNRKLNAELKKLDEDLINRQMNMFEQ